MKPIEEPTYTQVPNYILDHLFEFENEAELKVVLTIARKTFGWHKERDTISLTQLVKLTGMTRTSVVGGLERAVANGWIGRISDRQSFSYAVLVHKVDQSRICTSPESRPESVHKVDLQLVQNMDTQKKGLNKQTPKGGSAKAADPASGQKTNDIKAAYVHLLGIEARDVVWAAGEATAAKFIGERWTADQLEAAYNHFKSQPFWAQKHLSLSYLKREMPEFVKGHRLPNVMAPSSTPVIV